MTRSLSCVIHLLTKKEAYETTEQEKKPVTECSWDEEVSDDEQIRRMV